MKNIKVKLLWYSDRDGNGIVQDINKNEYYIDDSVLKLDKKELFKNTISKTGLDLIININTEIKDCLCAKNVRLLKK